MWLDFNVRDFVTGECINMDYGLIFKPDVMV